MLFELGEPQTLLGFVMFAGNMACPDDMRQCTWQGRYTQHEWGLLPGGMQGEVPLLLFDNTSAQNTLLRSPAQDFMAMSQARVNSSAVLGLGMMGTFPSLPAGFSMNTVLQAGESALDHAGMGSCNAKRI